MKYDIDSLKARKEYRGYSYKQLSNGSRHIKDMYVSCGQ